MTTEQASLGRPPGARDRAPRHTKFDARPENSIFADDGCEVAPHCLHCPLPLCKYDTPNLKARMARASRDAKVLKLSLVDRLDAPEIAAATGVTKRTVYRIVKNYKRGGTNVRHGSVIVGDGDRAAQVSSSAAGSRA